MTESESQSAPFSIDTVIEDAKKVITNPIGFYKEMPTSGGFAEPIIFFIVMVVTSMIISFIFSFIGLISFSTIVGGGVTLASIIIMSIIATIGSFIAAGIMFVIWKLMGSEKSYETAYRCIAYSMAIGPVIAIISFIPYLAGVIKTLWGCFLMYAASTEVHKIKASTAKIVFGIFAAIGVLFGFSSEKAARNFQSQYDAAFERQDRDIKEGSVTDILSNLENTGDLTPEEAGKQVGEFMKSMEKFAQGLEEGATQNNE